MKTFRRIIAAPFIIAGALTLAMGMAIRYGLTGATERINGFTSVLKAHKRD
jgi:hypothetical protein